MGVFSRILGNDQASNVNSIRFKILRQTIFPVKLRDSVVADKGIREYKDLSAVRRICEAFGIAGLSLGLLRLATSSAAGLGR